MSSLLPLWQTTPRTPPHEFGVGRAMQVAEGCAPRYARAHEKVRRHSRHADGPARLPAQESVWVQRPREGSLASVFSTAVVVLFLSFVKLLTR